VPNLILSPICHPQFKPGPPSEAAQTASQFLHQVIANSGLINPIDLCIVEGKYVWALYADITCLNFGGNILDTSVKALTAALKSVKIPKVTVIRKDDEATNEGPTIEVSPEVSERTPLKLGPMPLSCTVSMFDDNMLLDPTNEEEELSTASITVVLTTDNEVCHVHKPGGAALAPEKLQQCISLAKKQCKVIQKLIDSASQVDLMIPPGTVPKK
jgi:exosome complex component RRP43